METLRMTKNKSTPQHFLVKLQKLKDKEKILKSNTVTQRKVTLTPWKDN